MDPDEIPEATVAAIRQLATAITPNDTMPYTDGRAYVSSLTEAMIMVGEKIARLADAASEIAEAIRERDS